MARIQLTDTIQPLAQELGALVMMWNALEFQISLLIGFMLRLDISDEADTVLGNIDFQRKLIIAKSYGFVVKPTDDWHGRLTTVINDIQDNLCPERNRMIHDLWGGSDIPGTLTRINMTPKLRREQDKQPLTLRRQKLPVTADDIGNFTSKVIMAMMMITGLSTEFQAKRSLGNYPLPKSQ